MSCDPKQPMRYTMLERASVADLMRADADRRYIEYLQEYGMFPINWKPEYCSEQCYPCTCIKEGPDDAEV